MYKLRVHHPALLKISAVIPQGEEVIFDNLSSLKEGYIESDVEFPIDLPAVIKAQILTGKTYTFRIALPKGVYVPPEITKLDDIPDVDVPAPVDSYLLYFDEASATWKCRALVDADIPAGIARDTEVATAVNNHAIKQYDCHGVGENYFAQAEGRNPYIAVNRAGDWDLGEEFRRAGDDNSLAIKGGQSHPAMLYMTGKDEYGYFMSAVPNAAGTGDRVFLYIEGLTDNVLLDPWLDNKHDLGTSWDKWRHIYTYGLTHDQINVTDRKCSKCGKTFKVGDMWAYAVIKVEGDSTVKRPNIVKKLHNPELPATRKLRKLNEWTGKYEDIDEIVKVKLKRKHYREDSEHKGKVIEEEIEEEVENEYKVREEIDASASGFMACVPVCKKCLLEVETGTVVPVSKE